jgi:uncharacterized SAM-binding protein YcdF (DUF218 family)
VKRIVRLSSFALGLVALLALLVALNYETLPNHNTSASRFDALIVLGYPANPDGTPSPEQRERTLEAVREYRRGVAPHLIFSGGAPHNQYTEAHVMAALARAQGVPPADLFEEPQAQNTIQNIFYSAEILHAHGWRTAEVVSSPSHLPRASLILATFDRKHPELALDWRTHAAHWPPEYTLLRKATLYAAESAYCLRLRVFGFPASRFLPAS